MIDRRRVGQDLPQCVVLHVLGQLHEDRVPVRVLDREHPLKADSEFWNARNVLEVANWLFSDQC